MKKVYKHQELTRISNLL